MVTGNLKDFAKSVVDEIEKSLSIDVTVEHEAMYAIHGLHVYNLHRSYASIYLYIQNKSLVISWCHKENETETDEEAGMRHETKELVYANPKFSIKRAVSIIEHAFSNMESIISEINPTLEHKALDLSVS